MVDLALDMFGNPARRAHMGALAERYEFAPFSVLDARQGAWQERKRQWIAQGIKSEIGRSATTYQIGDKVEWETKKSVGTLGIMQSAPVDLPISYADFTQGHHVAGGYMEPDGSPKTTAGTSVFDPVLCELMYRWFCPEGGQVVDPFAGGSVRGIVAALLDRRYWGCDLSAAQIAANEEQRAAIFPDPPTQEITVHGTQIAVNPTWICGDAMDALADAPPADFILSCPPYGDLERYSDDPRDLSTMEYHTFIAAYKRIILRCAKLLKPGCMACFVVGDFRDKKGYYRGFVADTIIGFRDQGIPLYNDAILVTSVGSLPVRVSAQFEASRKLGKTHQNVLIFKKEV